MKKICKLLLLPVIVLLVVSGWSIRTSNKTTKANDIVKTKNESQETKIKEAYIKLPIHFEENQGQVNNQVSFIHKSQGKTLFLTADEAVFSLAGEKDKPNSAIRMKVKGANKSAKAKSEDKLQSYSNYFIGNDPSKWRTNVSHYGKVRYSDVYKGIDLVYHGSNQILEYDFEVAPQVDPKQIAVEFQGIEKLEIEPNGDLSIKTSNGTLTNHKPIIYQEIDGQKQMIAGNFKLLSNDSIGFEVGTYNPTLPLIIDPPVSLSYSTFLGGSNSESGNAIAVDSSGNAYVTGQTFSTNFPTMTAFQSTLVGSSDAFVTKLSPTGSGVYSTYLGGNSGDTGIAIAVDASGNAYITGATASTSFPLMNAFQSTFAGNSDAFVTKLSPEGNSLIYSTYLGSSVQDQGLGIAVDSSANAYIAGEVRSTTGAISSTNFPTMNAFQSSFGGGNADAFVTKLSSTGSGVYSTYLGGSSDESGNGIAIDASGNAYITGVTSSTTSFPLMGAFQSTLMGFSDAFVTKLSSTGSSLVYSTYLGGSGSDQGNGIAVDSSGNAYVTGLAQSTNFPLMNAFQSTTDGSGDAFVTKFSATGSSLVYSTYLGGSGSDQGNEIAVDSSGNAYVTGSTQSTDFPTMNAFQSTISGTPDPDFGIPSDAFVTQFSATGSSLLNSTYLGGSSDESGNGIAVDASGNAYVTGQTGSTNFPTTPGAFQPTSSGGDAFVTKLLLPLTIPTTTTVTSSLNPSVFGQAVTLTATVTQQSGMTTPTGMVEFFDGTTSLGTATLNTSTQASITTSAIQAGSRSITAMYGGDTAYSASTSAAITQVVNKANTTTVVSSSVNPSVFGQTVTFTATVSAVVPGSGIATGMVQFMDGATNLGSPVSLTGGQAQLSTSTLTGGTHSITAVYSGDSNFNGSNSNTVSQTVNKANTSSVVTSNVNPSNFNQSVTFTATVTAPTAPGTPTGTVQFKDGAANLGSPVSLDAKGKAQFSTSTLTGGTHFITAVYSGDGNLNSSTSAIFTQTVNPIASTTTLTATPNPSVFGQAVTLSATVTGVGATPTGTIQFKDGANNIGSPVTLVSGSASMMVSNLSTGTRSLTAVYSGDNNFNSSTSNTVTQTVNKANTTTLATSSINPSVFGQSVTFTATVSAVSPGAGTATGMVQFMDGATNLGSPVSLTGGQAQLSTSSLSVATHSITAMYLGDANFNASTSISINQVVNKANTATALTANPSQVIFGQMVTFTATVTAVSPGAGIPGGSVQFNNGASSLGTSTVNASGIASLSVALTTPGSNSITAVYSGNASFNTSTSNSATVFVASVDHNTLYVADTLNNRVQRSTNNGVTWQVLGNNNQKTPIFNAPNSVTANFTDTVIFVADTGNNRIQRSTDNGNSWTTIATAGTAVNQVNQPSGVAYDDVANKLYIADTANSRILVVTNPTSTTPSFAVFANAVLGNAIGQFNQPQSVAIDTNGVVYVADTGNSRLQVNSNGLASGWSILAGAGKPGNSAVGLVALPKGIYVDNSGRIWVADTLNNRIQVNINGVWSVFMAGGTATGLVNVPEGVVVNLSGNVFIADTGNNRIQSKPASGGNATVVGSPGIGVGQFNQPSGIR